MFRTLTLTLALAYGSTTTGAAAQSVPAATFNASYAYSRANQGQPVGPVYADGRTTNGATAARVQSNVGGPVGLPQVTAEANPFGVVSASATTVGVDGWRATANADTRYYFTVDGVDSSARILIDYNAILTTSLSQTGGPYIAIADANLGIYGDNVSLSFRSSRGLGGTVAFNPDLVLQDTFQVRGGRTVQVVQRASTFAINGVTASAYADPFFTIDPASLVLFPNARLVFSQFIENAPISGVPEPATWALMIAGFGAVGVAMRRRRTSVAFA